MCAKLQQAEETKKAMNESIMALMYPVTSRLGAAAPNMTQNDKRNVGVRAASRGGGGAHTPKS